MKVKYRHWLIILVTLAVVVLTSNVGVTQSFLVDTEGSSGNSLTAFTSTLWTQTTQADFGAGVLNNVDTLSSPGDIRLATRSDWYNTGWGYRKRIIIDHTKVSADLTHYPFLVSLASDVDLVSAAQSNGNDILFTTTNGTTKLDHEIEQYIAGTGQLVAWIRVPSLSSSIDTDIYMYYGNPSCNNQENTTGVWDSSFKMVQHLDDEPVSLGGTIYFNDFETEVGFDYGSLNPTRITNAKKNGTYGIRGNGDKAYKRACRQENSGRNVVFEAWVCPRSSDVTSLAAICFGQQTTGEFYGYQCLIDQRNGGVMQIRKDYNSSSPLAQSSVPTILIDTWYKFRVTWENNGQITFELYDAGSSLVASISANNNIYIDGYYGVAAYQNADWDDFRVESMGTTAGTRTEDSTPNGNNGIKVGANEPNETVGKLGNGQNFDGSNDYVNCGGAASLQVDYITVESWVKFDVNTGKMVIASIDDGTNRRWALYLLDAPYRLRFFVFVNNSWASPDYPWQPTPDAWYYIVGVKSPTHVRTFINGEEVGVPQPLPGVMDKDTVNLRVGVGSYPGYLDGAIDEVRISDTARSAEWIRTCYNNQSAPASFYSVENQTGPYASPGTIASQVLDTGTPAAWQDAVFWDRTIPTVTSITFEVRANDSLFAKDAAIPSWISIGGTSPVTSGLPFGRYKQWRATLNTSDAAKTPALNEVRVYYH
jgi:hypothetical protein